MSAGPRRSPRPRVGISSCLLGERVRYDGGHKRDTFLAETLGARVEWVPVCPEVECGLSTPREPMRLVRAGHAMRLVRAGHAMRLVTVDSGLDFTDRFERYAVRRVDDLSQEDLSGYVLKSGSPSCGLEGPEGPGLFAARLVGRFPDLPIEDERRLSDPRVRDAFVARVFAYWRLRAP